MWVVTKPLPRCVKIVSIYGTWLFSEEHAVVCFLQRVNDEPISEEKMQNEQMEVMHV